MSERLSDEDKPSRKWLLVDMTGQKIGRLTVLKREGTSKRGQATWRCVCECGKEIVVNGSNLRRPHTRSCGCYIQEVNKTLRQTHGMTETREFNIWKGIHRRCYDPNRPEYPSYGGRGITMCDRWRDSFENFFADMGSPPSRKHSIDRIDVNGNYEPGNCRWATSMEQNHNRRNVNDLMRERDQAIAERDRLLDECERLRRVEKHLRYFEIPDESIAALTKRLEAETHDHPELYGIIDDTMMNLDQLRKQRDEARADITRLTRERDEVREALQTYKVAAMRELHYDMGAIVGKWAARDAVYEAAKAWRTAIDWQASRAPGEQFTCEKTLATAIDTALAAEGKEST